MNRPCLLHLRRESSDDVIVSGSGRRGAGHIFLTQPMLLHAIDECTTADIEVASGLRLVAIEFLQRAEEQLALYPFEADALLGQFQKQSGALLRGGGLSQFVRQIIFGNKLSVGE